MNQEFPKLKPELIPNDLQNDVPKPNYCDFKSRLLVNVLKSFSIPNHIAFIMDGNRRFAKLNNLAIKHGHGQGFIGLRRVLEFCLRLQIRCVTIYAFSIENFNRSPEEVDALMSLASQKLDEICRHGDIVQQHNVRVAILGRKELLNDNVRIKVEDIERRTCNNDGAILNICMPYTSRDEMSYAMAQQSEKSTHISQSLMTSNSPPIDILVRTSGVNRLSDFLMYQVTNQNTLIEIVDTFWPEIGIKDLVPIILNWQRYKLSQTLLS